VDGSIHVLGKSFRSLEAGCILIYCFKFCEIHLWTHTHSTSIVCIVSGKRKCSYVSMKILKLTNIC